MLPNKKLIILITALSVLGFILVLSVLFDSYKLSILNQRLNGQTNYMQSQYRLYTNSKHANETRTKNVVYVIENAAGDREYMGDTSHIPALALERIPASGPEAGKLQGYEFAGESILTWTRLYDPLRKINFTLVQSEPNDMLASFGRDFGVPILITFLIVGWIMVWIGKILNALFKELNDQNILLESQSQKIKDARDVALTSNRAKTVFLANMSHEIRTPLTAIIGFSKSLLESEQNMQERIGAIKIIHDSGKHLLHIIDEILDLSKIETESLEVEKINVSPVIVLNEICPLMRMQAEGKGLEFKVNYEFPIPMTIKTDPTRLKQILLNLASNAVKFTAQGHIHINVRCAVETETIIFEVADSGIGMNKLQQKKVFTAFAQADSSTTRKYGGTGLGLTLSKQFAKKLGGSLKIRSEVDVGTTMSVTIKTGELQQALFYQRDDELPREVDSEDIPLRKIILSGDVLLAEDNPANQKLFELYLRATGANITIADNGKQAVEKALQNQYDLIFMDMQMPVMNGLEAVKELRKHNYQHPIIALTANSTVEDRDACLNAGCDGFVSKPVDRNKFIRVLQKYLPGIQATALNSKPILSSLLEDEPELVDIVLDFLDNMPAILNQIKSAHLNSDTEKLRCEIHKLKGVGAGYGYQILTDLAGKIEFQIQNHNRSELDILLADLEKYSERITQGRSAIAEQYYPSYAKK